MKAYEYRPGYCTCSSIYNHWEADAQPLLTDGRQLSLRQISHICEVYPLPLGCAGLVCTGGGDGHIKGWDSRMGNIGRSLTPAFDVDAKALGAGCWITAMTSLEAPFGQHPRLLTGGCANNLQKEFPQVLEPLFTNELKCVSMDNKAGVVSCPLSIINGRGP